MRGKLVVAIAAVTAAAAVGAAVLAGGGTSGSVGASPSTGTPAATGTVAVTRTVVATATVPAGGEGCTPGYWKRPQHFDSWVATGFTTGQTLESVFDVPDAFGVDNDSLLTALSYSGGPDVDDKARLLLRQAVAALLNSAHPGVDYDYSTASVIAGVNAALASLDADTILDHKDDLADANEAGCPLN